MTTHLPTILVVDDEADICDNMRDILSDLGFQVDVANHGLAALELVRKNPYDLALLDLKMPGMDGMTLYHRIKKLRSGTAAIVISAFASGSITNEALQAGVLKVLSKPVDFPRLLGLVNQALDQPLALIVDDDEDLCSNLWDLLHEHEYRVCVAHSEREAAERVQGREYDVILIDMKLPQGDGNSVFRLVKSANPQARTVAITGFRSETESLLKQVVSEGADAVCYKPFDIPHLLRTIEQLSRRNAS
jgi:two-component system response regulator HydG